MADHDIQIQSESPAAADLMFWSIAGHESLVRPSLYELTVLSRSGNIAANHLVCLCNIMVFSSLPAPTYSAAPTTARAALSLRLRRSPIYLMLFQPVFVNDRLRQVHDAGITEFAADAFPI